MPPTSAAAPGSTGRRRRRARRYFRATSPPIANKTPHQRGWLHRPGKRHLDRLLVHLAGRAERYSDFGGNVSGQGRPLQHHRRAGPARLHQQWLPGAFLAEGALDCHGLDQRWRNERRRIRPRVRGERRTIRPRRVVRRAVDNQSPCRMPTCALRHRGVVPRPVRCAARPGQQPPGAPETSPPH